MNLDLSQIIDVKISVVLWCLGYFLKHSKMKYIKRIANDIIPVFLIGTGILLACIFACDVTFNSILIGFTTAMFSLGIHTSGKNIFKFVTGTTIYVTPESLSNSTAKQEKYRSNINNTNINNTDNNISNDSAIIDSNNNTDNISDINMIDDNEVIIDTNIG